MIEGDMGNKPLSNWSCKQGTTALLLNGSDWLLKTVTDRTLRDTKLVRNASLCLLSRTVESMNLGVFCMSKTALRSFGSH